MIRPYFNAQYNRKLPQMSKNQYTLVNHTILPLVFRVVHPELQTITYLLKDPRTKSLLLFGANVQGLNMFFKQNKQNLQEIQHQSQCKLKYVFFNSDENQKQQKIQQSERKQQIVTSQLQGDLKPLVIGDLSVCFIDAKGYRNPFSLIAVTHLTETSTKFPVLFAGSLISPCSISYQQKQVKANQYLSSLQKIKFFPNESYIFPIKTVSEEDLLFAKALVKSPFIDQKIVIFQKNKKFGDALIPTTVLQQKMMNPYLMSNKFKDLLGTSDKEKSFNLLRKMRQEFRL